MIEYSIYLHHILLHRYLQGLESYSRCNVNLLKGVDSSNYNMIIAFPFIGEIFVCVSIGLSMILYALNQIKKIGYQIVHWLRQLDGRKFIKSVLLMFLSMYCIYNFKNQMPKSFKIPQPHPDLEHPKGLYEKV